MTTTDIAPEVSTDLGAKANRHLWGHFARHGAGIDAELAVIEPRRLAITRYALQPEPNSLST